MPPRQRHIAELRFALLDVREKIEQLRNCPNEICIARAGVTALSGYAREIPEIVGFAL